MLFEDEFIMAVDKPAFMTSDEVAEAKKLPLLHRLDRETSGVLLLTKDEEFRQKAVNAFKKREVHKEYLAVVDGKVVEAMEINAPILTIKKGNTAYSKISDDGKEAISHVEPSAYRDWETDRKSTRLNSSHRSLSRMPSSA